MLDAVLFALAVMIAGFAVLRALDLAKGALALGLAPSVGLAALAIISTWLALLRAPAPASGAALVFVVLCGLIALARERGALLDAASAIWRQHRPGIAVLAASVAVPVLVMAIAFAGVEVPLSPHDGAAHTEAVQAIRFGTYQSDWYPPGLPAVFAAWLEVLPWVDSARGSFDLGLSLPLLAAVSVFGLGLVTWRDLTMAATSALLLGFTYVYPYFPQIWSGWPLAASLMLVLGIWVLAQQYLERPTWRTALLAGLVLGGIVLIHGTELYTVAFVLVAVALSAWRQVPWRRLPRDLGLAAIVAIAAAGLYVPMLLHFQEASGAYSLGLGDAQQTQPAASTSVVAGSDPFTVFALGALGIDLPPRLVLLTIGLGFAIARGRGRPLIALGIVFAALATVFTFLSGRIEPVRQLYAIVFPWGMHYRLFMVVAIAQALVAGAGAVVLLRWCGRLRPRLFRRLVNVLAVTWLALVTWATTVFIAYPAGLVLGYSPDDAVAMEWLQSHASPGEDVVNNGYADAGIWAPYKADVAIVLPRWGPKAADPRRQEVVANVARLDHVPDATEAACALRATYVYYGARVSGWDTPVFPSLETLRASPALEEVFSSGGAVIFRLHLRC